MTIITKQEKKSKIESFAQFSITKKINDYLVSVQNIKIKDKLIFFRLLATMINAWVSVLKAFSILRKQEKNPVMIHILSKIEDMLREWQPLSYCLEAFPWSFSETDIGMIRAWEKTGKLNDTLLDIAKQTEKMHSISSKIKSAMIYPSMIMIVVLWVIMVMMTVVVPKLVEIFEWKESLPASTRALIAISGFFIDYWFFVILFLIASFIGFVLWKKIPAWKYTYDNFIFKIPVFGDINRKLILSRFSRIFWGLLFAGVSIIEALKIVSAAVWNEVYRQRILLLVEDVKQWIRIGDALEWDKLFPDMMIQMIQVWEKTAKIDETIEKVADFYDEQVDNKVAILNKLLEPFIIIFLAVAVGTIAIAIMQPIMQMADTISWG